MAPPRKSSAAVIFLTNIALEVTFMTGLVSGPTFRRIFELSESQLGFVLGAASVGVLVMSVVAGRSTHRRGPLPVLVTGIAVVAAGVGVVMCSTGFWWLASGLALAGIGGALMANANSTLLAELFRDKIRRVMSLASALLFASSALSAPAIGLWLEVARRHRWNRWGFRLPYACDLVFLFICLLLVVTVLRPSARAHRHSPAGAQEWRSRRVPPGRRGRWEWLWIPGLALCHGCMIIAMLTWANPMAQARFAVNEFQGSLLVGGMGLGLAMGRLGFSMVKWRTDERSILAVSGLLGGILFAAALAAPSYLVALVAIVVGGFVSCTTLPCIHTLIGKRFEHKKSHLYGYMDSSIALAGLLGPTTVGILADKGISLPLALVLSPLAAWTLAITSLLWKRRSPEMPLHQNGG